MHSIPATVQFQPKLFYDVQLHAIQPTVRLQLQLGGRGLGSKVFG